MTLMDDEWTPDDETERLYARYRKALKTVRELKPSVREHAVDDLRSGAKIAQLAEETGETEEVYRRLARQHDIPIDERYRDRAERLRKTPTPDA